MASRFENKIDKQNVFMEIEDSVVCDNDREICKKYIRQKLRTIRITVAVID